MTAGASPRPFLSLEVEEAVGMAACALLGGDRCLRAGDFGAQRVDIGVQISHTQRVKQPLFNEDLLFWPRFFLILHHNRP